MIKSHYLLDSEIAELRLKYREKHNKSLLIQGRTYFARMYEFFFPFKCSKPSP
jgi:hypothetical protein